MNYKVANDIPRNINWEKFTSTCIRSEDSRFWIISGAYKSTFMDDRNPQNNNEFKSEKEAMDFAETIPPIITCPIADAIKQIISK